MSANVQEAVVKHSTIKDFRRRLGWTQWDLAERLNVDQGTVSRWERGIESPRPSTASALRDLILREDDLRAMKRFKAMMAHSLQPMCFIDESARLRGFNAHTLEKYARDYGLDLSSHVGLEWERHAEILSMESSWEVFRDSGFMRGDLMLARFYVNVRGKGHVTQYEPIFELGKLVGLGATLIGRFDFPANDEVTLERAEVVHADAPGEIVDIHRGRLAEHTFQL